MHSVWCGLDSWVLQLLSRRGGAGSASGGIREWKLVEIAALHRDPSSASDLTSPMDPVRKWIITYQISGNRWCERIGRPHRSNHIMIIVSLTGDAEGRPVNAHWRQSCHDPDCRHYHFQERDVPPEVMVRLQQEETTVSLRS